VLSGPYNLHSCCPADMRSSLHGVDARCCTMRGHASELCALVLDVSQQFRCGFAGVASHHLLLFVAANYWL
jgi:hypothetical protein